MGWKQLSLVLILVIAGTVTACTGGLTSAPSPTPAPTVTYSQYQLEYILLDKYPDVFWVDSDFYPVAREGQEEINAREQFAAIKANNAEFTAILSRLGLPDKTDYSDQEKLSIYREHKKLTRAVTMTPSGDVYNFSIRTGENQGKHIEGTISLSGQIKVLKEEPSFNTRPICLTKGTLIATPAGQIPVEQFQPGMNVWTVDAAGRRLAVEVIKTSQTPVPPSFQVVKVILSDGRAVSASPGHPTAERRALGGYTVGDSLDGSSIAAVEYLNYGSGATYDLLPSGETGLYWANGIILGSTLSAD
jgi:hypothetical protein